MNKTFQRGKKKKKKEMPLFNQKNGIPPKKCFKLLFFAVPFEQFLGFG